MMGARYTSPVVDCNWSPNWVTVKVIGSRRQHLRSEGELIRDCCPHILLRLSERRAHRKECDENKRHEPSCHRTLNFHFLHNCSPPPVHFLSRLEYLLPDAPRTAPHVRLRLWRFRWISRQSASRIQFDLRHTNYFRHSCLRAGKKIPDKGFVCGERVRATTLTNGVQEISMGCC